MLITHEPDVAERASRVLRIRDGQIQSETAPSRSDAPRESRSMSWLDTLRTGWEAIRSHRLRSGLTTLGILIGIAAVVLTVGLGEGAQHKVSAQISALGSNLLLISPGSSTTGGIRGGLGSVLDADRAGRHRAGLEGGRTGHRGGRTDQPALGIAHRRTARTGPPRWSGPARPGCRSGPAR